MKFDFTDKASYLAWRAKWRSDYKALAAEIRLLKRGRKEFIRTYERRQTEQGVIRVLVAKEPNPHHTGATWKLHRLRTAAAYQMEVLKEAKSLSWQLKQARLAQQSAA